MNKTALSVIALAVGAVLIFGLYNVYKPQVNNTAHDVFDKVHIGRMESGSSSYNPQTNPNKPMGQNLTVDQAVNKIPENKWEGGMNIKVLDKKGNQIAQPVHTAHFQASDGLLLELQGNNFGVSGETGTSPDIIKHNLMDVTNNWSLRTNPDVVNNPYVNHPDMFKYSYVNGMLTAQEK